MSTPHPYTRTTSSWSTGWPRRQWPGRSSTSRGARGSRLLSQSRMRLFARRRSHCARWSVMFGHVAPSTGRLPLPTALTALSACTMRAERPRFPGPCTLRSTPRCGGRRGGRAYRLHVRCSPSRTGDPRAWESRAAGSPSLVPAFPLPYRSSPSALRAASRTRTSGGPSIARSAGSTARSSTSAAPAHRNGAPHIRQNPRPRR